MARSPFSLSSPARNNVIGAGDSGRNSDNTANQDSQNEVDDRQIEILEEGLGQEIEDAEIDSNHEDQPPRDGSGRIIIDVHGRSFDTVLAVKKLRSIIHSHYNGDWITFSEIPRTVKDLWFDEFKRTYAWDENKHEAIRAIWKLKASEHLRNIFRKARMANRKLDWVNQQDWEKMCKKWKTCEKFKRSSNTNKKNRAVESVHGSAAYTGGSISVAEHTRRFKKVNKRKPTMEELIEITYQKKSGEWSGTRPEKTVKQYKELVADAQKDGQMIDGDVTALWVKAAGGVKKGRVFGLGSQVSDVPQELLEKYNFASMQPSQPMIAFKENDAEMQEKVVNMEEKMENMAGAVETLTAQLSSFMQQQAMTSQPAPFMQSFSQSMQAAMQHAVSLANDINMYSRLLNPNIVGGSNRLMFNSLHPSQGFDASLLEVEK